MTNATPLPFDLPAVARKKLTVDFDGGNQSSDAGLLLLRSAEKKIGVCVTPAAASEGDLRARAITVVDGDGGSALVDRGRPNQPAAGGSSLAMRAV